MRVFIAIEIPERIKKQLNEVQDKFDDISKIKWVNDFHLTLKFLGEISSIQLDRIKERLKNLNFKNFELELTNLGVFPNDKFIRVLWVGLSPERKVMGLQLDIEERLRDMFNIDRKFKAHLTLGRVKTIKNKETFLERVNNIEVNGKFNVGHVKLIKSVLTDTGPEYETLEVYG